MHTLPQQPLSSQNRPPWLWLLVGEADVLATQGYSLERSSPDLERYVRTTLHLRGITVREIPTSGRISLRRQPQIFNAALQECREAFHRQMLMALARLDVFGQCEVPRQATLESVLHYGSSLLSLLERQTSAVTCGDEREPNDDTAVYLTLLSSVLGQLARQLAERLTTESVFYDATTQSVRIPSDSELTVRRLQRNDDLWLVMACVVS